MAWPGLLLKIGKALTTVRIVGEATKTVQKKTDDFIEKKKEAFVSQARTEAEKFMAEQILLLEAKIDDKILVIEKVIDEQIEKELKNKLRILIYTLAAVILMSLISLAYLYIKRKMNL